MVNPLDSGFTVSAIRAPIDVKAKAIKVPNVRSKIRNHSLLKKTVWT
jgi:hypothetical protein